MKITAAHDMPAEHYPDNIGIKKTRPLPLADTCGPAHRAHASSVHARVRLDLLTDPPVISEAPHVRPSPDPRLMLAGAKSTVMTQLIGLAKDPTAFTSLMERVYGDHLDKGATENIRSRILQHDFSWFPELKTVSHDTLKGAFGAYEAATHTVYLDERVVAHPNQAARVFLEELGHHLDGMLCSSDTRGDEGELFRRLVTGEHLSDTAVERIHAEDDTGHIIVEGRAADVEFWSPRKVAKTVGVAFKRAAISTGGAVASRADDAAHGVGALTKVLGVTLQGRAVAAGHWMGNHRTEILGGVHALAGITEVGLGTVMIASGTGTPMGIMLAAHGLENIATGVNAATAAKPQPKPRRLATR